MTGASSDVALRPLSLGDVLIVRQWRNDPEVARFMYTDHEIGEAEHARWFAAALDSPDRVYWIVELDGRPVGLANVYAISRPHRRAYWAFYLADPGVRGRGVGSFVERFVMRHAFVELGLEKLCCEVLTTNEAVIGMHRKLGFVTEGILRHHVWKDGRPVDVATMAILAGEWRERHGDG